MIEDDLELAQIIARYLSTYDIEVQNVDNAYTGLSTLEVNDYDLLILDLTLPDIDGLELLVKIRKISQIPVIISSARDDILDKVMGLERGADDYLPKPYNPRELEARIKSILRRRVQNESNDNQEKSIWKLDEESKTIYFKQILLDLTLAEFDILSYLIQKQNSVVSRADLIYNSANIDDNSSMKNIDVIISRIRHKLQEVDPNKKYIKSVRGIGYILTQ